LCNVRQKSFRDGFPLMGLVFGRCSWAHARRVRLAEEAPTAKRKGHACRRPHNSVDCRVESVSISAKNSRFTSVGLDGRAILAQSRCGRSGFSVASGWRTRARQHARACLIGPWTGPVSGAHHSQPPAQTAWPRLPGLMPAEKYSALTLEGQ